MGKPIEYGSTFGGIKIEFSNISPFYARMGRSAVESLAWFRRVEFHGALLPKDSPALVVYNHTSFEDTVLIPKLAAETAGRTIQMVAKSTLLAPETEKDDKTKDKTGKKDFLNSSGGVNMNSKNPFFLFYLSFYRPFLLQALRAYF